MNECKNESGVKKSRIFLHVSKLFLSEEDSSLDLSKSKLSPAYQNFLGLSVSLVPSSTLCRKNNTKGAFC